MTEGDWKTLWWWGMIVVAEALLMVACALVVVPVRKVEVPGARVTADVQVQMPTKDGGP